MSIGSGTVAITTRVVTTSTPGPASRSARGQPKRVLFDERLDERLDCRPSRRPWGKEGGEADRATPMLEPPLGATVFDVKP